jgi:hypothetical protein
LVVCEVNSNCWHPVGRIWSISRLLTSHWSHVKYMPIADMSLVACEVYADCWHVIGPLQQQRAAKKHVHADDDGARQSGDGPPRVLDRKCAWKQHTLHSIHYTTYIWFVDCKCALWISRVDGILSRVVDRKCAVWILRIVGILRRVLDPKCALWICRIVGNFK